VINEGTHYLTARQEQQRAYLALAAEQLHLERFLFPPPCWEEGRSEAEARVGVSKGSFFGKVGAPTRLIVRFRSR